jgi:hypothetical protein
MIPTGDPGLDLCLGGGYPPGALHVVAGSPGSGKTSWLRRSIRLALNAGKTVHVVDLERTIHKHFPVDAGISFETDLTRPFPEAVDLLVIDCVQLHYVQEEHIAGLARWLGSNLIPRLQRLEHPVKLMSWQSPRSGSTPSLPQALNYAAEVVLHLDRPPTSESFRAALRKNRFGTTGGDFGYTLPDAAAIIRPTIWERLEET